MRREKQSTFSGVMRKRYGFKETVDHVVIDKPSGFHIAQFNDGFIRKDFFSEPKGINCQNKACGLGTSILVGSNKICKKCDKTGYPKNSRRGHFSVYCPIRSITLNPVMLLGLISRHSRGEFVINSLYVRLTNVIIDRTRYFFLTISHASIFLIMCFFLYFKFIVKYNNLLEATYL